VQVGYVIEAPIWKTSYRLILDEKARPYLQGWAMVENPTDEDWNNVKMALISGRPISFRMDLYNPLYINRPTVEPELFASLRPVTYRGGFGSGRELAELRKQDAADERLDRAKRGLVDDLKAKHSGVTYEPKAPAAEKQMQLAGVAGGIATNGAAEFGVPLQRGTVQSAATAGALGDFFQYVIDHPVTLLRQKSAMLPIVGKDVEGAKVSIYNERVQVKHPLLGLRLKNTTGAHLNQGPITVFEGNVYAGDTQVLNVQPNEERLLSYAIDLGTEVDPKAGPGAQKITSVKAVKGIVTTTTKVSEEKTYKVVNRSQTDRTLVIEHPNRTSQQVKLVGTEKPVEETPEFHRFQTQVKAGETKSFTVKEERDVASTISLTNGAENQIRYFLSLSEASPALKKRLQEALRVKGEWDGVRRELDQIVRDLQRLNQDQDRIRKNLRETPSDAEVYKVYLKKLSEQEKEIDRLTESQKKLMADEFKAKKSYEDYLANIGDQ
jgi:hypothetical protein